MFNWSSLLHHWPDYYKWISWHNLWWSSYYSTLLLNAAIFLDGNASNIIKRLPWPVWTSVLDIIESFWGVLVKRMKSRFFFLHHLWGNGSSTTCHWNLFKRSTNFFSEEFPPLYKQLMAEHVINKQSLCICSMLMLFCPSAEFIAYTCTCQPSAKDEPATSFLVF